MKIGEIQSLPVNPQRLIQQMTEGTIRTILDAIVELVTNSDDSYKRLEKKGVKKSGKIEVSITRFKGGRCEAIEIRDYAEGMDRGILEKAVTFGEDSSGFEAGESVRGLFGRGLKEAILSLGQGDIYTFQEGKIEAVRIWWDKRKQAKFAYLEVSTEEKESLKLQENTGTIIKISNIKEKFKIPDYRTFEKQFIQHYALRDINSDLSRSITLHFHSPQTPSNLSYSTPIKYPPPDSEEIVAKSFRLPEYGDQVFIRILESPEALEPPPMGPAGFLIKTEGAILDNQLFKYQNESAGLYFFGEVFCKGIAAKVREGDFGLINISRAGLNWRDDYCKTLQQEIEKKLSPYIERKKQELEEKNPVEIPSSRKKLLNDLQQLLNKLAKNELSDEDLDQPINFLEITDLLIKPEVANLEVGKPRTFTIYAPAFLIEACKTSEASVVSESSGIRVFPYHVKLEPNPKYSKLFYGRFKVTGYTLGVKSIISCTLGKYYALAEVKVGPQKEIRKRKKLTAKSGGFIRDIKTDNSSNPSQRVSFNRDFGEIIIYLKFPTVSKYLGENLNGIEKIEGRLMLVELVGEAFCRELARRAIESNKYTPISDEVQAIVALYDRVYSDMQNKYLNKIHDVVIRWKRD